MKNINVFALLVLFVLLMFIAFKIGDSRGFEAGFKYGYGLDCQNELDSLKSYSSRIFDASEKANNLVGRVSFENARLRYELRRDSLVKSGVSVPSFDSTVKRGLENQKSFYATLKSLNSGKLKK